MRNRPDQLRVRFRCRNQLQQPHIARRIEKVRAKPRPPEVVRESLRNLRHRKSARVRGNNRPRLADRLHLPQQRPLDLQVLNHRLNDPVHVGQPLKIVLKISHRDQPRERGVEKCGRFRFTRSLKSSRSNLVPRSAAGICRQVRRNDIQQQRRHSRVSEMRRNPRPHRACAQHSNLVNTFHQDISCNKNSLQKFI